MSLQCDGLSEVRRAFLKKMLMGPVAASPLMTSLVAASAQAATVADDYKALVCVFLHGGNDSFNTVIGTSEPDWRAYTTVRNQQPAPLALSNVLPLQRGDASQPALALHPMLSALVPLYNTQKRLAIVANVGPLIGPLSKASYASGTAARPRKLFSHNDQQSTWQAMAPEGATQGWGGRMLDSLMAGQDKSLFTAITVSGNALWLSGRDVRAYQVASGGPVRMGAAQGMDALSQALQEVVANSHGGHQMAQDLADVNQRSLQAERQLHAALPADQISPFGPDDRLLTIQQGGANVVNPLAKAFQTAGRIIASHRTLGLRRQILFVSLGGFDTHSGQSAQHARLMAQLGHGLAYFDGLMQSLGLGDKVTTFTASDFGRSFTSNGDGTDHGWGAHHFIMGGAVQGGRVFGSWPQLSIKNTRNNDFDASDDQLTNGVLLPSTSVEQYGAALGSWLGVSSSGLADVFPNLSRFDRSPFSAGAGAASSLWRS